MPNLLKLLPGVLRTVGSVLGVDIFGKAADALSGSSLPPEKQAELEQAVMAHETEMRQLDVEAIKALVQEAVADAQSSDAYVRRARPTGLYVAQVTTAAMVVAMIAGVHLDTGAIVSLLVPMWGTGGYYMHLRTQEKLKGGSD